MQYSLRRKMTETKEKPNCYKCKYRGNVPGDSHSSCEHPKVTPGIAGWMMWMSGSNPLSVDAESHGIAMGWFMWPMNFDPAWLRACDGFATNPETT
jgi:hypothetical protein